MAVLRGLAEMRVARVVALVLCGLALALVLTRSSDADHRAALHGRRARKAHTGPRPSRHGVLLGSSVRRTPIRAEVLYASGARRNVVVFGCIHGNETAGIAVAGRLARGAAVAGVNLWVVPDLNPDGVAAGTRQNADGVDLNRNFPWHWKPLGPRGTQQYPGPRPISEPESRIARALILRLRPAVTIWFHQPLGVVDESGGSVAVERRFARVAHLPLRRLTRYPGSAASWQDTRLPRTTAFVVELPAGPPTGAAAARYVRAVRAIAAARLRSPGHGALS
jgi:murein peptide amidase A